MRTFTLFDNLKISRTGFGALPIQRIPESESTPILRAAYDKGITFFDTARVYSDSEEKINAALCDVRQNIVIASKSPARSGEDYEKHLELSLRTLGTDYIDIYQFHNTPFVPRPGGEDGLYDAALRAKAAGKIRAIGISQHSIAGAQAAVESGLVNTLQYPFNHLATDEEIALVHRCKELGVGFIAMKALSGGLVTDARIPFAYLQQFSGVVPIWGIQRMSELEQILALEACPPQIDDAMAAQIDKDKSELAGAFCRACGYCLPCPVGIPIQNANRMKQLMTRSPMQPYLSEQWQQDMAKIEHCTQCGLCATRCPYGLKPYETLPDQLAYYRSVVEK